MTIPTPQEWAEWNASLVRVWGAYRRSLEPAFARVFAAGHELRWILDAPAAYAEAIGEGDEEQYDVFI